MLCEYCKLLHAELASIVSLRAETAAAMARVEACHIYNGMLHAVDSAQEMQDASAVNYIRGITQPWLLLQQKCVSNDKAISPLAHLRRNYEHAQHL